MVSNPVDHHPPWKPDPHPSFEFANLSWDSFFMHRLRSPVESRKRRMRRGCLLLCYQKSCLFLVGWYSIIWYLCVILYRALGRLFSVFRNKTECPSGCVPFFPVAMLGWLMVVMFPGLFSLPCRNACDTIADDVPSTYYVLHVDGDGYLRGVYSGQRRSRHQDIERARHQLK